MNQDLHTVFRQEFQPDGGGLEHNDTQNRFFIFNGKVEMSGSVIGKIRYFAMYIDIGKYRRRIKRIFYKLIDL